MLEKEDLTKIQEWLSGCGIEASDEIFSVTKTYIDLVYRRDTNKFRSVKMIEHLNMIRLGEISLPQIRRETHEAIGRLRMTI